MCYYSDPIDLVSKINFCNFLSTLGDLSAQLSRELGEVERSPTPEKELPCYLPALMGCRSVEENYDYLNKIEEGTYGVVHRAKDKKTGQVALRESESSTRVPIEVLLSLQGRYLL